MIECKSRKIERINARIERERPGRRRMKIYSRLLERAEQLPEHFAESIADIQENYQKIEDGSKVYLGKTILQFQAAGEMLVHPFEITIADKSGRLTLFVDPEEPYRHPRFGEAPFTLGILLEQLNWGDELQDITLVKRPYQMPLSLWEFDIASKDDIYFGDWNGRGRQESRNILKEVLGRLLPGYIPIPVRE